MGSLTRRQRLRLAREARKLAMECVEETAPEMNPYSYCGCACGEIVKRAHRVTEIPDNNGEPHKLWKEALQLDGLLPDDPAICGKDEGMVSSALRAADLNEDITMLVFPLLALADAIEEAQP